MHRFFLQPNLIQNDSVIFPKENGHQISRVLRLEVGKHVQVLDGLGRVYTLELTRVDALSVEGKVIESAEAEGETNTRVRLFVALTQREKFEWILQKCTEIGVSSFTPLITTRSLIQKPTEVEGKYQRWQKIVQEAAEQSHRGIVPDLEPVVYFHSLMETKLSAASSGLFFWEEESQVDLKSALAVISSHQVNLVIGPEGGFTPEEAELAVKAGYTSVSLGKRILREETAAIIASGLVIYQLE